MAITRVKIFPSIGIARLGNSPDEFFVGPELPGDRPAPPGGYKDARCRIKRQAARFRLFGYDGAALQGEITAADADITWTVHLANTKASWRSFAGQDAAAPFRNAAVADRSTLEIDPGAATLTGPNQAAGFNTGRFRGRYVPLGEMRTEPTGRLLVLGGFGRSGSVPDGAPITHYANNDDWYDDVSDGPVTATVTIGGTSIPVDPAWVLCSPPDFAPPIDSLTTLYDVLFQVAVDDGLLTIPASPSLVNDIIPILARIFAMHRVNPEAASGHFDFDPAAVATMSASRRQAIFARLRDPANPNAGGSANMPKLYGDTGTSADETVTPAQYTILQRWKDGTFTDDWTGTLPPPPTSVTPEGLTRAALEACVGGAFFPGIEASWFLEKTYSYSEPFRLDPAGRAPGDVTKQMAVPWQADFFKCYNYGGIGWWPAQRPDDVYPEAGGGPVDWIRDIVFNHDDMIAHWSKLGFVADRSGALVETERHVVCKSLLLVTDKSHFSRDEVDGALTGGSPAQFGAALYVIAEGFTPGELGITAANPTEAQLAGFAPTVTITRPDGSTVPGMTAVPEPPLLLQDSSLPAALRQRFTFVYRIEFANADGFSIAGTPTDQTVTATATKVGQSSTGTLFLFHQPNPYMLDGATSWLSTDVRVFKIVAGQTRFGQTIGNDPAAARAFIAAVVNQFNGLGPAGHPFDAIATDQQASRLELSEKVGGTPVFNFAVARVRYRGNVVAANDVRVFFRLFTTAATGMDYDESATYRRTLAGTPMALLGLQAGKLVTIPCFADQRVDSASAALTAQLDPLNVRTLTPAGAGEQHGYFGCWLDFNQTAPQFPGQPSPVDGPWASGRRSIQELIRGLHQCLVAEVHFLGDPIPAGVTPAANDNLAQRNLAIAESDNPGSAITHTVAHTFEIRASRLVPQVVTVAAAVDPDEGGGALARFDPQAAATGVRMVDPGPDELMIRWHDLPRETVMTLYLPDLDAEEIVRHAGQRYDLPRLEKVDDHTVRCLTGDVSFVPLPHRLRRNLPALLTLELPDGIKRGQAFRATVHQLSGLPRRILGAFELAVPVSDREAMRAGEERSLSVLRHIGRAIPVDDPWYAVFDRYLHLIAERVRGLGGDPESIEPSADGSGAPGEGLAGGPSAARLCSALGWTVTALLALLVVLAGMSAQPRLAAAVLVAGLAAALVWAWRCRPSRCRWWLAGLVGLALGGGVLGLAALVGAAGPHTPLVLALAGVGLGAATVLGLAWRCLRPGGSGP